MHSLGQKILLLLSSGIAFGYSYTPRRQFNVLKGMVEEWKAINKRELRYEIKKLYNSRLVARRENADGSFTLVLTEKGRLKALTYRFQKMKISRENWDKKWRIVIFDIPEKLRKGRDALREKLKDLGFYELQKSVFVFPYQCEDEINFIIEFFGLRKFVRTGVLESVDNEIHLKNIFGLDKIK